MSVEGWAAEAATAPDTPPVHHSGRPKNLGKTLASPALAGYDGAVIPVTHDRYFIKQLADEVVDLGAFAVV
ncbi:MAG: hypothetical protein HYX53_18165 [Chloroflexi bacterium]|nr:hypothetical protein [Chloroflexota bacterium]